MADRGVIAIANRPTNASPRPGSMDLAQSIPGWPAFTNLVRDSDRSYRQTSQITEINNFLSAAVKRANANLVLISSFPNVEQQEQWLVDALKFELYAGTCGHVINVVGERASRETDYFYSLLSMVIAGATRLTFRLLTL